MVNTCFRIIRFSTISFLLLLSGTGYCQLSNLEVEKVLKAQYPRFITKNFELNDFSLSPGVSIELQRAKERGLATYKYIAPGTSGYGCYGQLTDAGRQYFVRDLGSGFVLMAAAKVKFVKVTGIREIPAFNTADVEYLEQITEVTPVGKVYDDIIPGQVYKSTASFIKYNDGWRLDKVNTGSEKISIAENPYLKGAKFSSTLDSLSYAYGIVNINPFNSYRKEPWTLNPYLITKAMQDKKEGKPLMNEEFSKNFLILYPRRDWNNQPPPPPPPPNDIINTENNPLSKKSEDISVIVDNIGKVFLEINSQSARSKILDEMGYRYNIYFSADDKEAFSALPNFGVPIYRMKDFLANNNSDQKMDYQTGIPYDSTDNQLQIWLLYANALIQNTLVKVKPSENTPISIINKINKIIQDTKRPVVVIEVSEVLSEANPSEETPFVVVEEMPSFPGGETELLKYIDEHRNYPENARKNKIQGRVLVRFCITSKGGVSQVSILKGVDRELDAEAIRVVNLLPTFNPGKQGGVPVPVWHLVPVTFIIK
jgi:TonB family protein